MKFKKLFLLFSLIFILGACSKTEGEKTSKEGKNVTVTTSFIYDMVKNLVGDKVNMEMIIPAGEDPHLYVSKPTDLEKIKKADLVLYHGLHFEGKMVDVLEQYGKEITKDFDKSKLNEIEEDGVKETDPHFWFDLELYKKAFENTKNYLAELLPEEKDNIEKNYSEYVKKLDDLNEYNKKRISEISEKSRYLITPHDAFNYFAASYKMEVLSPQGITTDSEVSNSDVEEIAAFIAKNQVKAIFAESTTNPERMEKIKQVVKSKGFDVKVVSGEGNELFSDSLAPAGQKGDNFIDMYKHNVDLIVENLK